MILSCTNHYAQGNIYLYRLRSPQHCRYHPIVLLHGISCQSGSFGEGRELCDLRVEAHIVPQLALFLGQLFRRGDARKLLLEIFAFLVHLRDQRLELFLALLAGMGVDVAGMLCPVRPYGRIASLKQVVIEFADAAGTRFPFLPHIGPEVYDAFPFRFRFFLRLCLADDRSMLAAAARCISPVMWV